MKIFRKYFLIEDTYYRLLEALDNHNYTRAKTLIKRIKKLDKTMLSTKELLVLLSCGVVAGIALGMLISKYFIYE